VSRWGGKLESNLISETNKERYCRSGLFFRLGLLLPDFDILVARNRGAAFRLLAIGRADLYYLRFGCDCLPNETFQFRGVAL
jgi:hypothetical protein